MNYSIIFRKKYTLNDIIKYSKINGPTYILLLWALYQTYFYSKGFVIQQIFKLIRVLTPLNNKINNFKNDMANTFQQSPLTLYKIPDEGMNEKQIFNLFS